MRVFVAGANGAVGRRLVPMLVARGHQVTGTTTSEKSSEAIRAMGADPVVVDGLDAVGIGEAVARAEPDAIIHEMTALSGTPDFRHFDRWFALTNRLRTEGTEHLLAAAQASGVKRFVAQSFTGWSNARTGGPIKTEDDPLDPNPVKEQTETLAAIKFLERAVLDAPLEGIVVRYGGLYGPGSSETLGAILRKRMFPVIGNGAGIVSSTHVDDAANGTVAALERGRKGIYNIVDDDPAPSGEFIPAIAEALGAPKPLRIPAWLGRLLAGDVAVTMMTEGRGSSNAKAKRELGWQPIWPSWRDGFRHGLDSPVPLPPRAEDGASRRPKGHVRRVTPAKAKDDVAEAYVDLRPLLFSIAYRMLSSVSEAEDVVQEAFVRYQRALADGTAVESPKAYLSAVVTRLAIDHLKSARVRRETYVGEWLPEPLVTDQGAGDPAEHAEEVDSLSMSFLLLLERLTPVERAVFLLHDVFDYDFEEVGRIVGKTAATCRQHAVRARKFVAANRPRFDASEAERDELLNRFFAASEGGDIDGLIQLLAENVVVHGDGGGKVPQWFEPIIGPDKVARLFARLGSQVRAMGATFERHEVNGQPGVVFRGPQGGVFSVMSFEVVDGRVATIRSVVNPDKLGHFGPVESLRDVLDGVTKG